MVSGYEWEQKKGERERRESGLFEEWKEEEEQGWTIKKNCRRGIDTAESVLSTMALLSIPGLFCCCSGRIDSRYTTFGTPPRAALARIPLTLLIIWF